MKKKSKSSAKRKSVKHHPVEKAHADKATCKACEMSSPLSCPLCSKTGLVLIALAIIMVALGYGWSRILGWVFLAAAFLVPVVQHYLFKK